ncbi:protein GVQW3 [Trichonephila clavipes]|nr:protein GVQW3 [Trichonephila clavipes]
MTQKKHLDDFLRGRTIGRLQCERTQQEVSEELGIAQSVISRLWFSLQSDSRRTLIWRVPGTRYYEQNTIERHRYGGAGWLVWGRIILGSRTDLHVHAPIIDHIYRDVILEQYVRLFRGAMGAEFLFMNDNARPHHANIVDGCLQSANITRMDWPAYSPDLNPTEHVTQRNGNICKIQQAYGDSDLSRAQVFRWFKAFLEGRESIEDEPLSGRPSVSKTTENVVRVLDLVRSDRRLTIRMIGEELNLNHTTVHQILTNELKMRKICAKMVPKNLSQ